VIEVKSVQELDGLWKRATLLLFKHSTQCGLSAAAYEEVERFALQHTEVQIHLIKVLEAHPVSAEIERRTGIEHESPQVLVVKDGAVVWHASHRLITAVALRAQAGVPEIAPAG
jgi:bacillithiol system protein YtxJ